jgi:hypothetical protein
MSIPTGAVSAMETPSGPSVTRMPSLAGVWLTRTSRATSISYSSVEVAPGPLLL